MIALGIDLRRFAVEPRAHEGRVVGNVARLVEQKDQRALVEAAPAILERFPDARFVIVGEGELRGELEAASAGLPIELAGDRDDVPELLAGFDVFAFPSRFEGLCLAVIEAQAAGVPVVATPVGGIRETVMDGETGLIVPVGDPVALAAAVCRLLEDGAASRAASGGGATPGAGALLGRDDGRAHARALRLDRSSLDEHDVVPELRSACRLTARAVDAHTMGNCSAETDGAKSGNQRCHAFRYVVRSGEGGKFGCHGLTGPPKWRIAARGVRRMPRREIVHSPTFRA